MKLICRRSLNSFISFQLALPNGRAEEIKRIEELCGPFARLISWNQQSKGKGARNLKKWNQINFNNSMKLIVGWLMKFLQWRGPRSNHKASAHHSLFLSIKEWKRRRELISLLGWFAAPQTQTSFLQLISWRWMKSMKKKWVCLLLGPNPIPFNFFSLGVEREKKTLQEWNSQWKLWKFQSSELAFFRGCRHKFRLIDFWLFLWN